MSAVSRACLRLAATAALRDVTIAGGSVFDSRIEAINLSDDQPIAGAIAVYTEQDEGEALDKGNGGPPFVSMVDLILEITMQSRVVQADGTYVVIRPVTDDELEATLDLIETQAEDSLFRSYAKNSVLFRLAAKRPDKKLSLRFTDPKEGQKLAVRYVTYTIEIDDREVPVLDGTRTGFDTLPYPFSAIAPQWPPGPEQEKATVIAALLAGITPPAFKGVIATVTPPASTQSDIQPEPNRVERWDVPQQ
jgi:hypothetical protein